MRNDNKTDKMIFNIYRFFSVIMFVLFLISCRGNNSSKPAVHLNVNMDFQAKKNAQSLSLDLPEGAVGYGYNVDAEDNKRGEFLKNDQAYYYGKKDNNFITKIPVKVNKEFIMRGKKNFNIYCAVCHDKAGTGKGVVITRGLGFPPPPTLSDPRLMKMNDGEIFEIISLGRRTMPSYNTQIKTFDKWTIVGYVRALQLAKTYKVKMIIPDKSIKKK